MTEPKDYRQERCPHGWVGVNVCPDCKKLDEKDEQIGEQIRLAKLLHDDLRGEIAEKEREIIQLMSDAQRDANIISKFTARIKELEGALEKITAALQKEAHNANNDL
jgi:hypothetical protein